MVVFCVKERIVTNFIIIIYYYEVAAVGFRRYLINMQEVL